MILYMSFFLPAVVSVLIVFT